MAQPPDVAAMQQLLQNIMANLPSMDLASLAAPPSQLRLQASTGLPPPPLNLSAASSLIPNNARMISPTPTDMSGGPPTPLSTVNSLMLSGPRNTLSQSISHIPMVSNPHVHPNRNVGHPSPFQHQYPIPNKKALNVLPLAKKVPQVKSKPVTIGKTTNTVVYIKCGSLLRQPKPLWSKKGDQTQTMFQEACTVMRYSTRIHFMSDWDPETITRKVIEQFREILGEEALQRPFLWARIGQGSSKFAPSQTWRTYTTTLANLREEFRSSGALYIFEEGWEDPANDNPQWRRTMCHYISGDPDFWEAETDQEDLRQENMSTHLRECTGCGHKYPLYALSPHEKTCKPYLVRRAKLRLKELEEESDGEHSNASSHLPTLKESMRELDRNRAGKGHARSTILPDRKTGYDKATSSAGQLHRPNYRPQKSTTPRPREAYRNGSFQDRDTKRGLMEDEPIVLHETDSEQEERTSPRPHMERTRHGQPSQSISPNISPVITVNNHHISSSVVHTATSRDADAQPRDLGVAAMSSIELLELLSTRPQFGQEWLLQQRTRLQQLRDPGHIATPTGSNLPSDTASHSPLRRNGSSYNSPDAVRGTSQQRTADRSPFEDEVDPAAFDEIDWDAFTFDGAPGHTNLFSTAPVEQVAQPDTLTGLDDEDAQNKESRIKPSDSPLPSPIPSPKKVEEEENLRRVKRKRRTSPEQQERPAPDRIAVLTRFRLRQATQVPKQESEECGRGKRTHRRSNCKDPSCGGACST